LEFEHGFLLPASIPLEEYDSTRMIPVTSLNLEDDFNFSPLDDPFAVESLNLTTKSTAELLAAKKKRIFLGATQVGYGCKASIQKPLGEAINALCNNSFCDAGSVYTRKVTHMNKSHRSEAWLWISIEGRYYGRHTRGYVAAGVKSTVTPQTAKPATRYRLPPNPNLQAQKCVMSKFGNYIHVSKNFGDTVDIRIRVTLHTSNSK
jgi:hypothetical protein